MTGRAAGLRLFGWYALASALPIALLGAALFRTYKQQSDARALREAVTQAQTVAYAGIEPVLAGHDLAQPMQPELRAKLIGTMRPMLASSLVLRARLRDATGVVVLDPEHPAQVRRGGPDEEASAAARGAPVRALTSLGADTVDGGTNTGERAVETYLPLHVSSFDRRVVGVLEVYVPYAPIQAMVGSERRTIETLLVVGLALLWLTLSLISASVARRLRRNAERSEYLAFHDPLTELPNRALFADRAAHALAHAGRTAEPVSIAVLDLLRFKSLNDTLGHENGDRYLRHIADTLRAHLRPGDTLARVGGDEFGIVLPATAPADAERVLHRVLAALVDDIDVGGVAISSEANVGLAAWPDDGETFAELLPNADLALEAAKASHVPLVRYRPDLVQFDADRLALVSQLRNAIAEGELVLHYQPKLHLDSDEIESVEALIRWAHPTRGMLAPGVFLDVAESTGLIDDLTNWVLDTAIAQIAAWGDRLPVRVAVNVSARNLRSETLAGDVIERLQRFGVDGDRLELEITETAIIEDPARAAHNLTRLRAHGVRVVIDDFGQGYTSLAQLGALPVSGVKIDRSFVADMLDDPGHNVIVSAVVELGHNFGLEVVAEGVEEQPTLDALRELGCDVAQGFLFSKALPADELLAWVVGTGRRARAVPVAR